MNLRQTYGNLIFPVLLASSLPCRADTLLVNAEGTGQYPTIRAAVNAAVDGDEIHLVAGTYTGEDNRNINYQGKAITIRSQNLDPESTIIDLDDGAQAFILESGEGPSSVLEAVTITHGDLQNDFLGLVRCQDASPSIRSCIFYNNIAQALNSYGGAPTIEDCQFTGNYETGASFIVGGLVKRCLFQDNFRKGSFGGAIAMEGSTVVEDCIFIHNAAGLGGGAIDGAGTLRRCLFRENDNAVNVYGGELVIESCTIVECGGLAAVRVEKGTLALSNSIIALNSFDVYDPLPPIQGPLGVIVCTNLFGNSGGDWEGDLSPYLGQNGNISADPLFCDLDAGNDYLFSNSPCAPANSNGCGLIGAYGVACEPTSVEAKSWGKIKVLYR